MLETMNLNAKILLLAGSAEARESAVKLQELGCVVHAVVSEPPKGPNPMPMSFELLQEVSQDQLCEAMRAFDLVVDASHGFDGHMTAMGAQAAVRMAKPFVVLSRPGWSVTGQSRWKRAKDVASAMKLIAPQTRVFSATGWASIQDFETFPGAQILLRQTTRHDRVPPFDFVELVFGQAPFSVQSEMELFQALGVDLLMCRNLGGKPSRPKLDAAEALGLDVILIDRPALPEGAHVVQDVAAVIQWVVKQCSL
ncbi:MAG: precorrin-6A/cobalt-precorrin-6A reductase [Sulfitobacter sp.]